jgi:hypothetical protein
MINFATQNLKIFVMKRVLLTLIMTVSIMLLVRGQEYKTALGLRGGFSSGLTIKHFTGSKAAFEGLLTTRWQGFVITGLYEIHNIAFDVNRLRWYYGGGAHIGFYNGSHVYWGTYGTEYTIVGIDGILGMEYTFSEIPINIGIDWKPVLNIVGYSGLWSEGGISVRFVF